MSAVDDRPTIGLNLTWLVPGVVGGSEEYTVRLLTAVAASVRPHARIRAYGRASLFARHRQLARLFEPVPMPGGHLPRAGRVILEQTWLGRVSADDDVMHHLGGTVPVVKGRGPRRPLAVTIHDLQPIDLAHNFSPVKRTWLGRLVPLAVGRADLIICPSQFTADRIVDRFAVDRSRVRVVPQGYQASTVSTDAEPPSVELKGRLAGRRFLLYPAIAYRHKRHRDLIAALARLPERCSDIDLVFTGRPGPESQRLREQAVEAGMASRLHLVGRVPEADLHWLYDNAVALAFASEYEGFGNPILEAMARGCPVLAADAAAVPEVLGDAGRLVTPGDIAAWVDAIVAISDDPSHRAELIARGRTRADAFDPANAATRLWAAYRHLLDLDTVARSPSPT